MLYNPNLHSNTNIPTSQEPREASYTENISANRGLACAPSCIDGVSIFGEKLEPTKALQQSVFHSDERGCASHRPLLG
jgi:hypothetical protein